MKNKNVQRPPVSAAWGILNSKADTQAILDEIDRDEEFGDAELMTREIMRRLEALQNPTNTIGMKRFGITGSRILGIPVPVLRKMAKQIGKDHFVAQALWDSGVHEARLLASMVGEPDQLTSEQMDAWMTDFDSWDVCDQACGNLFDKNPLAWKKAAQWARREKEFERRAGFALMATLAWHEKPRNGNTTLDKKFEAFFPLIIQYAVDERNFVKKAVNWALRQIGKRNPSLRKKAIATAKQILRTHPESKAARFVANDAIRELSQPSKTP